MNRQKFIEVISNELNYDKGKCEIICDILENHFLVGKNNKNKIVNDFMEKLNIDNPEAEKIYEITSKIISREIKNKVFHPFGNSN